jgi:hypothetical protein
METLLQLETNDIIILPGPTIFVWFSMWLYTSFHVWTTRAIKPGAKFQLTGALRLEV